MDTQIWVSIITVMGVTLSSGIIQFFVTRKDNKKEAAKLKELEDLRSEFREGLKERDEVEEKKIAENSEAITKLAIQHDEDFRQLKEAIQKLTENDTNITESIKHIESKQMDMAESLVGQAHDRIIFLTDKISNRGAITNKEKATIKSIYEPYKKLGGNGEVQVAVEYVNTLQTISELKARDMDIAIKGLELQEMRKVYES